MRVGVVLLYFSVHCSFVEDNKVICIWKFVMETGLYLNTNITNNYSDKKSLLRSLDVGVPGSYLNWGSI